jgi:hypothetical protein
MTTFLLSKPETQSSSTAPAETKASGREVHQQRILPRSRTSSCKRPISRLRPNRDVGGGSFRNALAAECPRDCLAGEQGQPQIDFIGKSVSEASYGYAEIE